MDGLLEMFLLLAVALAFSILLILVLPSVMSMVGRLLVRHKLKSALPSSYYTIFNNVSLDTGRRTTQIDHVVVSSYGIFVIETRHLYGWITGSWNDRLWTRTLLRFNRRFQNPIRQNQAHIRALQGLLGVDSSKFHSLVVFTAGARFKSPMPVNVTVMGGLLPFIQVRTDQLMDFEEAVRVAMVIRTCQLPARKRFDASRLAPAKPGNWLATAMHTLGNLPKMRIHH
jgi:restriction system protein